MVSIVLASHGDLAAGIKQTGSMVFGDQPSVAVVSLEPSMGPDDICGAARRSTRLAGSSRAMIPGLSSPVSTCLCSSRHIRSALMQRTLHMRSQNIS